MVCDECPLIAWFDFYHGPSRSTVVDLEAETRYFIVKSFNEENVLRCIQDVSLYVLIEVCHLIDFGLQSVWTTQVQNGSIFKEAFETCKNVILVFSINKSRAFQGYVSIPMPSHAIPSLLPIQPLR